MLIANVLLAATAILPADKLRIADHHFNEGKYQEALTEYSSLKGEVAIREDEILFRLAETSRMAQDNRKAREYFTELINKTPKSKYASRSRLMRAVLTENTEEKIKELRSLDNDKVDTPTRSAALFHLGTILKDPVILKRSIDLDPNGRFAASATFQRAAILTESKNLKDRNEATNILLNIGFSDQDVPYKNEALFIAAVQNYRQGDYIKASGIFEHYLRIDPEGSHARQAKSGLAWCYYLTKAYTKTLSITAGSDDDDLNYLTAAAKLSLGENEEANRLFHVYLEKFPVGRNRVNAELAIARFDFQESEKKGDMTLAIEAANRAASLSKNSGDKLRLAWAYEKDAQVEKAQKVYDEIRRQFPGSADHLEALFRSAMLEMRQGHWSKAEIELKEALKSEHLGKRKALAQYWLGFALMKQENFRDGEKYFKEALSGGLNAEEEREASLAIADIAYEAGREEEAKAVYEKLILEENGCDRMSAAKILAIGKFVGGKAGRFCANRLIENSELSWQQAGYALLGKICESEDEYDAAVTAYRKAMEIDVFMEDIAAASLALGRLEMKRREFDNATATLTKAIKFNSDFPHDRAEGYMLMAENYFEEGNLDRARAYAEIVVTLFDFPEFQPRVDKILGEGR